MFDISRLHYFASSILITKYLQLNSEKLLTLSRTKPVHFRRASTIARHVEASDADFGLARQLSAATSGAIERWPERANAVRNDGASDDAWRWSARHGRVNDVSFA